MRRKHDHHGGARWRLPLFVTLAYLVFGVMWIVISDNIVLEQVKDSERLTAIQTYKGWVFVALSAGLLFGLISFGLSRLVHARQALERSRIEYHQLVKAINDGIWIRDTDGSTLFVNNALARLVGIDEQELRQSGVQPYLRDNTSAPFEDDDDLVAQRSQVKKVVQIVGPNETARWALLSINPVLDVAGDLLGDLIIITDITDRIAGERALREANESQRRLLDELHHRVRNNLASLHSLLDLTRMNERTTEQAVDRLHARITAMTTAHELLSDSGWKPVPLRKLLERIIEGPYERCIELSGPAVSMKPEYVSPLGGVIAELFSHARAEGALQGFTGRVSISWSEPGAGSDALTIEWVERSERPIHDWQLEEAASLIRGLVTTDLRGSLSIETSEVTLTARISLPMDVVSNSKVAMVSNGSAS